MINESFIKVKSTFGHDILNHFLTHSPKSEAIVVIFPGSGYSCDKPLLHYARKSALLSGCDVLSLEYGYFKTNNNFKNEYFKHILKESSEAIKIALANSYNKISFISKSLGTIIAGEISKSIGYEGINNLYLTPTEHTIPYITKDNCTVVVGTNDKHFRKANIDLLCSYPTVDLHIINGASHALEIDHDYLRSIEILKEVTAICVRIVSK